MVFEHEVNGLHECRFVGDLPFPPPSGGRQGRQFCLRMAQTFFQPRGLLVGMHGGAHHQYPFLPCRCVPHARRITGPLKLIALGRQHLVTTVIGAHYTF